MLAAGIVLEEKNWPPFFPIIHHDIANEIPIHLQKIQYVAFTTYLGMFNTVLLSSVIVVGILDMLLLIWFSGGNLIDHLPCFSIKTSSN